MGIREPLHIGATMPEMLANDLALELRVATLRDVMAYCETAQDYHSREILCKML